MKATLRKVKAKVMNAMKKKHVNRISLKSSAPISHVFGFDRGKPIDRYYIEQFLMTNASLIHGNILEIADSGYSRKYSKSNNDNFYVLTLDQPKTEDRIIKGDLTKDEMLPENFIDCFICTQTFNFIYDVKAAIRGAYKMLKPGGVILCTVSGLSQISRYDMDRWGDYWRFTDKSIEMLMKEAFPADGVQVFTYGNAMSATAFIQGLSCEDISKKELLDISDKDYQVTIGVIARKG